MKTGVTTAKTHVPSVDALGAALSCSPRVLHTLLKRPGAPVKEAAGWNIAAVRAFRESTLTKKQQKATQEAPEKARILKLRADLLQVELDKKRGLVYPAEQVRSLFFSAIAQLKLDICRIVYELPAQLANGDIDTVEATLRTALESLLDHFASSLENTPDEKTTQPSSSTSTRPA